MKPPIKLSTLLAVLIALNIVVYYGEYYEYGITGLFLAEDFYIQDLNSIHLKVLLSRNYGQLLNYHQLLHYQRSMYCHLS